MSAIRECFSFLLLILSKALIVSFVVFLSNVFLSWTQIFFGYPLSLPFFCVHFCGHSITCQSFSSSSSLSPSSSWLTHFSVQCVSAHWPTNLLSSTAVWQFRHILWSFWLLFSSLWIIDFEPDGTPNMIKNVRTAYCAGLKVSLCIFDNKFLYLATWYMCTHTIIAQNSHIKLFTHTHTHTADQTRVWSQNLFIPLTFWPFRPHCLRSFCSFIIRVCMS